MLIGCEETHGIDVACHFCVRVHIPFDRTSFSPDTDRLPLRSSADVCQHLR